MAMSMPDNDQLQVQLQVQLQELQKQHEAKLTPFVAGLTSKGTGTAAATSDFALARALVHRAVHLVAERKAGEFCALATFLAEMITHAHQLLHTGDSSADVHAEPHGKIVH